MTIDLVRFLPEGLRSAYAQRPQGDRAHAQKIDGRNGWYQIKNLSSGGLADIYIYDEIGFWGITAGDFVSELMSLQADTINLHINSPGGEVFDGIAIHSALSAHAATVNVFVDALAASIASVIAMAGDTVTISKSAMMMIHDGSGLCIGNAADMRTTANLLDKCSDTIAQFYADRAGGTVADWRTRMQAETWYTGQEAVDAGLADGIVGAMGVPEAPDPPEVPEPPGAEPEPDMSARFEPAAYGYRGPRAPELLAVALPTDAAELEMIFDPEAFRRVMLDAVRSGAQPGDNEFMFDSDMFRNAVREASK